MSGKIENIVVVGGGGVGAQLARFLSTKLDASHYNLVLITASDNYFHLPALLRPLVTDEGHLEDAAAIPYDSLFAGKVGTVKFGKAVAVEKNPSTVGGQVVLQSGERVPFTYLVVATGSVWEGPLASMGNHDNFALSSREWRDKIRNSRSVVIVGAGAVGLELAGEIRDIYKEKKITIVQAAPLPLNDTYPEGFRKDVLKRWKARNIDFVLGDRVDVLSQDQNGKVTTATGREIPADLIIPTRGGRPNTEFLKSLGAGVLDSKGYVKIQPTMQLEAHADIFAAGDIIAIDEQKQLAKGPAHISVVGANIISLLAGKRPAKKYAGTFEAIFITNGKSKGAGYVGLLWGLTFGDKIVGSLKSKDLFVTTARKNMGIKGLEAPQTSNRIPYVLAFAAAAVAVSAYMYTQYSQ